jgi:cardiolipin synthase
MADASPPQPPSGPVEVMGNTLRLLPGGAERLDALIALIDGAHQSLRLLFYIFKDDATGARVRDACSPPAPAA